MTARLVKVLDDPRFTNKVRMRQPEIESTILRELYESYFRGESGIRMQSILEKGDWDEQIFWKVVNRMEHDHHILDWSGKGDYRISDRGIFHAEKNGIAPEDTKERNQRARLLILDALVKSYDEGGDQAVTQIDDLAVQLGCDTADLIRNIQLTEVAGLVQPVKSRSVKITHEGLDAVAGWRKRIAIVEEFEQIEKMKNPQARGRKLQKLFARVVEQNGWPQEEGVKTSNEEIDVMVHKEREYYLIESKWEKDRIETGVIGELFGKLARRADVRGIVVSMSGFTKGAVKAVEGYVGQRIILLFGPNDVRKLIHGESLFDELLNAKYQELVTRRKAVFE